MAAHQIISPSVPISSTSKVPDGLIGRAADALIKWVSSKAKIKKAQLFDHDEFLYLVLSLHKIPQNPKINPYKIPLPHPLIPFDDGTPLEACLIIDDRPKSGLNSKSAKQKIEEEKIPISKVLKLSKLKSDYRPFEARRKLCGSYDVFFADKRVIPLLPRLLGKSFFKKKKTPIPVDLTHQNWKEQMKSACHSALFYQRSGSCSVIKVAKISQTDKEILENVKTVIDGVVGIVSKKWKNVRALHLKTLESIALPLYQSVPERGFKIEAFLAKETQVESGDKITEEAEVEEEEEEERKKGDAKGRIHQIRYMNSSFGDDMGIENSNESEDDESEVVEEEKPKKRKSKGSVISGKRSRVDECSGSDKKGKKKSVDDEKKVKKKKKKMVARNSEV